MSDTMTETRPAAAPRRAYARRTRRRPRILVVGEFSSGKSRLVNGLLGAEVLPSNVTSTALPPVWLTRGSGLRLAVDLAGTPRRITLPEEATPEATRFCLLTHPAPILSRIDIIDTPGTSDPNIPAESWERMIAYADAVLWCTSAVQAWRQSEKAVWDAMPRALRERATLLVTHADRLPDARAAERVLRRVKREAGDTFAHVLMGSNLDRIHLGRVAAHLIGLFPKDHQEFHGAAEPVVTEASRVALPAKPKPEPEAEAPSAEAEAAPADAGPRVEPAAEETPDLTAPAAEAKVIEAPAEAPEPEAPRPQPTPAEVVESLRAEVPRTLRPRALWGVISRGIDPTDAEALRTAIERLLDVIDASTEEDEPSEPEAAKTRAAPQETPPEEASGATDTEAAMPGDDLETLVRETTQRTEP